jgi:hypothetical protein
MSIEVVPAGIVTELSVPEYWNFLISVGMIMPHT